MESRGAVSFRMTGMRPPRVCFSELREGQPGRVRQADFVHRRMGHGREDLNPRDPRGPHHGCRASPRSRHSAIPPATQRRSNDVCNTSAGFYGHPQLGISMKIEACTKMIPKSPGEGIDVMACLAPLPGKTAD